MVKRASLLISESNEKWIQAQIGSKEFSSRSEVLNALQDAGRPADLAHPAFRLHPLKGQRLGQWSMRVSDNWRIVSCFRSGEAVEIDLIDYH